MLEHLSDCHGTCLDLVGSEERLHLGSLLGRVEGDARPCDSRHHVGRERRLHLLPVGTQVVPRKHLRVLVAQQAGEHVRRILHAHLIGQAQLERALEQLELTEPRQRGKEDVLLVRRFDGLEELLELLVTRLVTEVGEDVHDHTNQVGVDRRLVLQPAGEQLLRLSTHLRVFADPAEGREERGPQLGRLDRLTSYRRPTKQVERRLAQVADDVLQRLTILLRQNAMQRTQTAKQNAEHSRVGLAGEQRHHLQEFNARAQTGANAGPGIVDQVVPLDYREVLLNVRRQLEGQVAGVTDAVNARTTRIHLDPLEALTDFDGGAGGIEEHRLLGLLASRVLGLDDQRNRPEAGRLLLTQELELLLRDVDGAGLAALLHRNHRVTRREHPSVHDATHGDIRTVGSASLFERIPEVAGLGVAQAVALQVDADALTERLEADVLVDHVQYGATLVVGDGVEELVDFIRMVDRHLDRVRALQPVDPQRRSASGAEAVPDLPLGLPHRQAEVLHEGRERLVQPETVPPEHGDQVAEPEVRLLMQHCHSDAFQLVVRSSRFVAEQSLLAVSDATGVLHGAGLEVRNRHVVDLVTTEVRHTEVVLEPRDAALGALERPARHVLLAGHAPDANFLAVHEDRLGAFELTDDEAGEVRRHLRRTRKLDELAAPGKRLLAQPASVGQTDQVLVDHEPDLEGGLELGLIEAREALASLGGLVLRGDDDVRLARLIIPAGLVEAPQTLVVRAREAETQLPVAGIDLAIEADRGHLGLLVDAHRALDGLAAAGDARLLNGDFADVQGHDVGRFLDGNGDRLLTAETTALARGIREKLDLVVGRYDVLGQTETVQGDVRTDTTFGVMQLTHDVDSYLSVSNIGPTPTPGLAQESVNVLKTL